MSKVISVFLSSLRRLIEESGIEKHEEIMMIDNLIPHLQPEVTKATTNGFESSSSTDFPKPSNIIGPSGGSLRTLCFVVSFLEPLFPAVVGSANCNGLPKCPLLLRLANLGFCLSKSSFLIQSNKETSIALSVGQRAP